MGTCKFKIENEIKDLLEIGLVGGIRGAFVTPFDSYYHEDKRSHQIGLGSLLSILFGHQR
jgi:hypothetical protein